MSPCALPPLSLFFFFSLLSLLFASHGLLPVFLLSASPFSRHVDKAGWRGVANEAAGCSGLFAIKDYRDSINQDDFNKAVRKVAEAKKLEGKLEYQKL